MFPHKKPITKPIVSVTLASQVTEVDLIQVPNQKSATKAIILPNGVKAVLISDPKATQADLAISVPVGSFNEPDHIPGLAHFLEHMLFMGTEKYPDPAELDNYLSQYSGDNNAATGGVETTYYFSLLPPGLEGAIDRLAQFFIAPKFSVNCINKEKHAVDTEYRESLNDDNCRSGTVDGLTCNPGHPAIRFDCGDKVTLSYRNNAGMRLELQKFFNDYYGPQRLNLAIKSTQSLEQIQQWVTTYFSAIVPRTNLPYEIQQPILTENEVKKIISIRTLQQKRNLHLSFTYPLRDNDPIAKSYLLSALNLSVEGSLHDLLVRKHWVQSYSTSWHEDTYRECSLTMTCVLTDLGLNNIDLVIQACMAYLNFLKTNGIQENYFNELKAVTLRNLQFRDSDYFSPADIVDRMLYVPLQRVLVSDHLMADSKFVPEAINHLISLLSTANMRIIIENDQVVGTKIAPRYKVSYNVQDFSAAQLAMWNNPSFPDYNFAMPSKNELLPSDFNLVTHEPNQDDKPVQIHNAARLSVWYKPDHKFKTPKQILNFIFKQNNLLSTARNMLLAEFAISETSYRFHNLSYELALAGVGVTHVIEEQGFSICFNMFSDRTIEVLDRVAAIIMDANINSEKFELFVKAKRESLQNLSEQDPVAQASLVLKTAIVTNLHPIAQQLHELQTITAAEVSNFLQQILANCSSMICFMHGNLTPAAAIKYGQFFATRFGVEIEANTPAQSETHISAEIKLPNATKFKICTNVKQKNAGLVACFQAPDSEYNTRAKLVLLRNIMEPQIYDRLRTKEQLAYMLAIDAQCSDMASTFFFAIQSSQYNAAYLFKRFLAFLQEFRASLTNIDLNPNKAALRDIFLQAPENLSGEHNLYWNEIKSGKFRFNIRNEIATALDKITNENLCDFFDALLLQDNSCRHIVVTTRSPQSTWSLARFNSCLATSCVKDPLVAHDVIEDVAAFKAAQLAQSESARLRLV